MYVLKLFSSGKALLLLLIKVFLTVYKCLFPGNDEDPSSLSRKKVCVYSFILTSLIISCLYQYYLFSVSDGFSSGERNWVLHMVTVSMCLNNINTRCVSHMLVDKWLHYSELWHSVICLVWTSGTISIGMIQCLTFVVRQLHALLSRSKNALHITICCDYPPVFGWRRTYHMTLSSNIVNHGCRTVRGFLLLRLSLWTAS